MEGFQKALENELFGKIPNLEPQEKNEISSMIATRVAAQQSLGGPRPCPENLIVLEIKTNKQIIRNKGAGTVMNDSRQPRTIGSSFLT
jgi:hypothetical protein